MEVSTRELRIQPGKIIDQVVNGEEVTVTFRGKALARIVPVTRPGAPREQEPESIFGLWASHPNEKSVEETVRELRKGRAF